MNDAVLQRLETVLDHEIQLAEELAATLATERAALTGLVHAAVVEQAAIKTALVGRIESLESERRNLWDPAVAESSASVSARWRSLMEVVARCRKANDVNGYIINTRSGQVRQLIDVVRGGAPVTYGPAGKTFSRALRALARA
jgi:flagellar biosynthesis/type III secretory pathway chaperone